MTDKMELGEDGYVELTFDDFGFTGEDLTILEYRANYVEEPECFAGAEELVGIDIPLLNISDCT